MRYFGMLRPCGVIFDLDGLLVDSEVYWEKARRRYARHHGCDWTPGDELGAKGLNSQEWASLMRRRCRWSIDLDRIIPGVVAEMESLYRAQLPVLPGAPETVRALASLYPLGLASSSPFTLIEFVLDAMGLRSCFQVVVSSDQVGKGKPSPDVFLEAARQLGCEPGSVIVFEDSSSGIQAAKRAGMHVIAVPNAHFPPHGEALDLADRVVPSLREVQVDDIVL